MDGTLVASNDIATIENLSPAALYEGLKESTGHLNIHASRVRAYILALRAGDTWKALSGDHETLHHAVSAATGFSQRQARAWIETSIIALESDMVEADIDNASLKRLKKLPPPVRKQVVNLAKQKAGAGVKSVCVEDISEAIRESVTEAQVSAPAQTPARAALDDDTWQKLISASRTVRKILEKITSDPSLSTILPNASVMMRREQEIIDAAEFGRPRELCPQCFGNASNPECVCQGKGWLTKHGHEQLQPSGGHAG